MPSVLKYVSPLLLKLVDGITDKDRNLMPESWKALKIGSALSLACFGAES